MAPHRLTWSGSSSNVWDNNNTPNFSDLNNNNPGNGFHTWDHVTFDNSSSGGTVAITLAGVTPGRVVFNSSQSYMLTGGPIKGDSSLVLSGGGNLILANTNTFTGGVTVSSGVLTVANAYALNDGISLTIGAGGTLIFDPSMHAGSMQTLTSGNALLAPATAVPEPSTFALLAVGALLIGFRTSRRQRS